MPATKSTLRRPQSTAPATKSALRYCACHEICTSRSTKRCACHEICTSRFTKRCACYNICALRFASKITISKALHLPRNLHFEVKTLRLLACQEKSTLHHQNTRFSLRLPRPSCPKIRTAAPQQGRSRDKRPLQPSRFFEPAQSKCTWRISRGVNLL